MKKLSVLLLMTLALGYGASAQQDSVTAKVSSKAVVTDAQGNVRTYNFDTVLIGSIVRTHNFDTVLIESIGNIVKAAFQEDSIRIFVDSLKRLVSQDISIEVPETHKKNPCRKSDIDFVFLWGWNNWGGNHYDGFVGLDGAYDARTSFSSYQMELDYVYSLNCHWGVKAGLSFESDVYKFNNPAMLLTGNALVVDATSYPGISKSRLVARYIDIPVGLSWRTNDGKFGLRLSAVPGFAITGKHTGLKVKHTTNDGKYTERTPINGVINPLKCDVRMEVKVGVIKLFVQLPTMPVFNEDFEKKIYPAKFGFLLPW
ncbi:MAG: hypothetical protein MJZ81_04395 [Bacteroidales bacterium]|nr:hypothetical protein [Bacteroidales bacterium]